MTDIRPILDLENQLFDVMVKRERMNRLKDSADFQKLPPGIQVNVHTLERNIRLLIKDIQRRVDDFEEEYTVIEAELEQLNLKKGA